MNFGINGQPETINAILTDGTQPLSVDEITNALTTIDTVHHEVHEGETFTVSLLSLSIANNTVLEILLRTGIKYPHLFFFVSGGGDAEVELVENPTVNAAGTAMTEFNNNRESVEAPTVSAFHTPTVVGGTVILEAMLAGGTGGNSAGGIQRSNTEFILKPNEDYVLRITNRAGTAQPASIVAQWYEESTNG